MTVESQSTAMATTSQESDVEAALRKTLRSLGVQKESLEAELEGIVSELTSPPPSDGATETPPMGIDTPLVDADGYPRGDIDVYRARVLRGRLATIKTDHKEHMKNIDGLLLQLAALKNPNKAAEEDSEQQARAAPKPKPKFDPKTGKWVIKNWDGSVAGSTKEDHRKFDNLEDDANLGAIKMASTAPTSKQQQTTPPSTSASGGGHDEDMKRTPFSRVNAVAAGSPAEVAGLQPEDLLIEFGPIHSENHNNLKAIADLVPDVAGERGAIPLLVRRSNVASGEKQLHKLELRPQPWNGRGLLGCHILPYSE